MAAPAATGCQVSFGLFDVGGIEIPGHGGMPGVPLATPPASITDPVARPLITAASFAPVIVIDTTCSVPSTRGDREGVGQRRPTLSACTAVLLLSSV